MRDFSVRADTGTPYSITPPVQLQAGCAMPQSIIIRTVRLLSQSDAAMSEHTVQVPYINARMARRLARVISYAC
jgi:hypothetical protein